MTGRERDRPAGNRGGLGHDLGIDTAKSSGVAADLRGRRAASQRLPILASGRSDPWHYDEPPLTACQIDGAVAAAKHLPAHGLVPVFRPGTVRAMRRAGHHRIVDRLRGAA